MSEEIFKDVSPRKIAYLFTGNKYAIKPIKKSEEKTIEINDDNPYYGEIKKFEAILKAIKSSGRFSEEEIERINKKINEIKKKL